MRRENETEIEVYRVIGKLVKGEGFKLGLERWLKHQTEVTLTDIHFLSRLPF